MEKKLIDKTEYRDKKENAKTFDWLLFAFISLVIILLVFAISL